MVKKIKHKLEHLSRSKIVIAVVQIEGPQPKGKHKSLVGERNSLVWRSLEDANARVERACEIVDALDRLPLKADIVVFPEYSLPVVKAVSRLQERSNQYNQILIPGSDCIVQPDESRIYNQCPIIIPNAKKPVWVTKREVSQWEQGLVDDPDQVRHPVFIWEAEGRTYWFSVYICLDFRFAKSEANNGGGVFIVPMCSPDVHSFRGWGDDALRLENGTATVLCNCIGGNAAGQSGVVAVVPDSKAFKSAFELPESKEAVAVFEIDCKQLAPPRKTNPSFRFALGKRYFYSLLSVSGRVEFNRLKVEEKDVVTRGVINPAIFEFLGKTMRMAFLTIDNFWEVVEKLRDQDFEVLAILGQHDLLITHLHEKRYDMIYDIKQIVTWKTSIDPSYKTKDGITEDLYNSFPFFRVDVYFKVLGVKLEQSHRLVFENHRMPTLEERVQIMKLGTDWNDEQIPEEARERFIRLGWILKTTDIRPGEISFIMTVSLDHVGPELQERQTTFENRVMPEIVRKKTVTSVYRGRPQSLAINYVLRIWSSLPSLYSLIEEIYKLASDARVSITTTTYVVLRKLSDLSLEKAVLAPMLTAEETFYRNTHIAPVLSKEDRDRLVYLSQDFQSTLIKQYQRVREAVGELSDHRWLQGKVGEIERKLAKGLLERDFVLLKEPHDVLQTKVETLLKEFINKEVKDEHLDAWRSSLAIASQKKKNQLSYTERIKIAIRFITESGEETNLLPPLVDLIDKTTRLRNALSHSDWENLTIEAYVEVLVIYCRFLSRWAQRNG